MCLGLFWFYWLSQSSWLFCITSLLRSLPRPSSCAPTCTRSRPLFNFLLTFVYQMSLLHTHWLSISINLTVFLPRLQVAHLYPFTPMSCISLLLYLLLFPS
ncbi:hypothetical protein AG1IA_01877 [Rhizoctonia solani AG-1 IA]|uniref:Uncharacterized protein n=1 Tax=Thanatephorus cucumeris (strain AG1-IA) TaxID=983506 RepID=L8X627_THACA|nr:hypothetical protein AG1IA_01877 [Rhizoctonia solani AG-1 IA]